MKDKELERIFKAFANKRRIAILRYLKSNQPTSVSDIAEEIKLSLKSTSKHLIILSHADIVDKEQKSVTAYYSLSSPPNSTVKTLLGIL